MEARYVLRKRQLRDACPMAPEMFEQVIPRLYAFMQPFVQTFQGQAAAQHAKTYCQWFAVGRRTQKHRIDCVSLCQSHCPQGCNGGDAGDDAPLRHALVDHGTTHVGQADGVLVFDPSGFPNPVRESVGVARRWCGRLGQVDPCQVSISLETS